VGEEAVERGEPGLWMPGKAASSIGESSPVEGRRAQRRRVERRVRRRERDVSSCSCAALCAVCRLCSSCV
jgi:hypothetical protein